MVLYDEKAHLIFIPHYLKYNSPTSPNQVVKWKVLFDELPDSSLKIKLLQQLKAISHAITDGMRDAINNAFADDFEMASRVNENENFNENFNENDKTLLSGQDPPDDTFPSNGDEDHHLSQKAKKVLSYLNERCSR